MTWCDLVQDGSGVLWWGLLVRGLLDAVTGPVLADCAERALSAVQAVAVGYSFGHAFGPFAKPH